MATAECDNMPGQIPDPSVTAGSLPSLGPLAGISATTLTDALKFGELHEFKAMLSPLHFIGSLGKRPLVIKTEVLCVHERITLNTEHFLQNAASRGGTKKPH